MPVLLRADGETLARCRPCALVLLRAACRLRLRARRRTADVLLQLYLEQNASIYHQTRLLFAVEGVDSVLDVGCGFGYPVDVAAKVLGWRAIGIDPAFDAGEGARLLRRRHPAGLPDRGHRSRRRRSTW